MHSSIELICDSRCTTGESPVWIDHEQALYWVDIPERLLLRWCSRTGEVTQWHTHEMLGCIALRQDAKGFIAGMESGIFSLEFAQNKNGPLIEEQRTEVTHPQKGMRFNDGRCDRQGRFWSGTMVMDMRLNQAAGALYRYTPDQGLNLVIDGLLTPNGLAFSPDGKTMYLSDSHPLSQKIWAFDYDCERGIPSHQRLFVDMQPYPGRPDGAAVDTQGCYWICANDAGMVHRFTPQGQLDFSLELPIKKPAMCAFGGSDGQTLFITSIRPSQTDLTNQPLAGGVFATRVQAQGLPEPRASFK